MRKLLLFATIEKQRKRFLFLERTFRGPIIVRVGPSNRFFHLLIKENRMLWSLTFLRNPLRVKRASGFEESIPARKIIEIGDWVGLKFTKTGEAPIFEIEEKVGIAPRTWLNPGPRTPGWIRRLDSGEAIELIKEQDFRKYEFRGKELKDTYFFRREAPGMAIWEMSLSAGPGTERLPLKKLSLFKDDRFSDKIPILKFDEFKGIIYGIVLRPDRPDAHGDIISPEEIEKAAHTYLIKSRRLDLQHERLLEEEEAAIVESAIARQDEVWEWKGRKSFIPKGSWWVGVQLFTEDLKEKVKSGEIGFFSIRGFGRRKRLDI